VFLVWVESTGETAGAGQDVIRARIELLPTPRVADLTSTTRRPLSIGIVADGSVRVDEISAYWFTEDHLRGVRIPVDYPDQSACEARTSDPGPSTAAIATYLGPQDPTVFFYEIVEDGRGDDPPMRRRYKLGASPWRDEEGAQWAVVLEPMSSDTDRLGNPTTGADDVLDVPD
jgi:hypothetical protein